MTASQHAAPTSPGIPRWRTGGRTSEPEDEPAPPGDDRRHSTSRLGFRRVRCRTRSNGRPGISELTRQRILKIADDLGWYPNSAARALSGARAGACGLVLARPARTLAFEPFFMELIAGIETELSRRSVGLTLQVAHDVEAEMAIYRRWWAERRVDGVLVVDPRLMDPRVEQIEKLGLPAVVIGGPEGTGGLSAVWSDDAGALVDVVRYLARLGHERIARVAGVPEFLCTEVRTEAYLATMAELSLSPRVVTTDFMAESGARVTRQLLADPLPPTAIIYDSEVLAVAGLGAAHEMGLSVPLDVSLVAWDDSTYCQVVHPPLTAVKRDIPAMGAHGASALLALIDDGVITRIGEPLRPAHDPRGTTARPPHTPVASPRGALDAAWVLEQVQYKRRAHPAATARARPERRTSGRAWPGAFLDRCQLLVTYRRAADVDSLRRGRRPGGTGGARRARLQRHPLVLLLARFRSRARAPRSVRARAIPGLPRRPRGNGPRYDPHFHRRPHVGPELGPRVAGGPRPLPRRMARFAAGLVRHRDHAPLRSTPGGGRVADQQRDAALRWAGHDR